ncbi:BA14K-like protein [Phyllobacterium sp. YR620]|uniref:Lectin-like protein BA14k n=1 Tax=Phyllobacterium pellucidum TaxID=2740464 RepID=A0A849VSN3_9HYPH|nr:MULTISPECIES: BA14K family protein [Phyllobacterium]MRG56671.1 BA14K family protein [Phyllobacterium sp. SYP-B3895]NTS31964.1 BA14K family protein [Phyllobacterium pellucidum]SDO83660.1 BA14K-like protein [Phyllobacterium sp. YR620]SFJ34759.1 BA14K-like protein [Phyllobacterium sp. CL33Tsu]
MNIGTKIAILTTAALATVVAPLTSASADNWRWRHGGYYHHDNSDAWVAGAAGLAAGALIGGALAAPRQPDVIYRDYDDGYYRRPVTVYREAPRYYGAGARPWSREWYRYCSNRYRSFNPETGTFRGYDGRDYFCNAN